MPTYRVVEGSDPRKSVRLRIANKRDACKRARELRRRCAYEQRFSVFSEGDNPGSFKSVYACGRTEDKHVEIDWSAMPPSTATGSNARVITTSLSQWLDTHR